MVGPPCPSKAGETPNSKPTSPSLLQSSVRIPHIKLQGGIFVRSHTLYYSICTNVSRNWSAWGHRHVLAATSCEVMDKNKRSLARAIQESYTQPFGWKPRNKRVSTVSLWRILRDDNRGLRPRKFEARRQCPPCYSHTHGVTFRGGQAQSTRTLDLEPDASVFNRESEVVVSTFVFPSGYHVGP